MTIKSDLLDAGFAQAKRIDRTTAMFSTIATYIEANKADAGLISAYATMLEAGKVELAECGVRLDWRTDW